MRLRDWVNAVIFDLNFTLVYWDEPMLHKAKIAEYLNVPVERLKKSMEPYDADFEVGLDPRRRWRSILEDLKLDADPGTIFDLIGIELRETLRPVRVYLGVTDMIERLHDMGLRTALCSNVNYCGMNIARELGMLDLLGRRHALSYVVGARKPHAAMYRAAAEAVRTPAEHCLFVGDGSDSELFGAHAFGMLTVRVAHPQVPDRSELKSNWVLPTVTAVPRLIEVGSFETASL